MSSQGESLRRQLWHLPPPFLDSLKSFQAINRCTHPLNHITGHLPTQLLHHVSHIVSRPPKNFDYTAIPDQSSNYSFSSPIICREISLRESDCCKELNVGRHQCPRKAALYPHPPKPWSTALMGISKPYYIIGALANLFFDDRVYQSHLLS